MINQTLTTNDSKIYSHRTDFGEIEVLMREVKIALEKAKQNPDNCGRYLFAISKSPSNLAFCIGDFGDCILAKYMLKENERIIFGRIR